jgi:drug/metabolite transporter (DMT)-like permease
MSASLSLSQALLLTTYALGMSVGQVLFKLAALQSAGDNQKPVERLMGLWHSAPFIAALALYAALAILWVWILSFTPLSRAYPFVALAFAFTAVLGGLIFGEALSPRLVIGLVVIGGGLLLVMG